MFFRQSMVMGKAQQQERLVPLHLHAGSKAMNAGTAYLSFVFSPGPQAMEQCYLRLGYAFTPQSNLETPSHIQ